MGDAGITPEAGASNSAKISKSSEVTAELSRDSADSPVFGILGASPLMRAVATLIQRISDSDASVLVTGESGTGKELTARAIHLSSKRKEQAFVPVNLPALPDGLIESELFGHERGAFTDAHAQKHGVFSQAHKGTIFLDEIGELAPDTQAKLLRVLQEKEIRPIGATRTTKVDVRVIAATNRNLEKMLRTGAFREDLYYRLNVIDLRLPPLRERDGDVGLLAQHFLQRANLKTDCPKFLSPDAIDALGKYSWPGNVRELQNIVERVVALSASETIRATDLPTQIAQTSIPSILGQALAERMTLSELEQSYIERVLKDENGNKTRAALRLGLDRKTLYRKLEEYARSRPQAPDHLVAD